MVTMKATLLLAAAITAATAVIDATAANPDPIGAAGAAATWTTVYKSPLAIEGLTGDRQGNLYVAQRGGAIGCPILRIRPPAGVAILVGTVAPPCSPSGLTFDAAGKLYVTGVGSAQDAIDVLTPSATSPPTATQFATGVPGANGIAFDKQGALWATDGTTGLGRVWKVPAAGGAAVEVFRIPTVAAPNGVGRQVQTLQGTQMPPVNPNTQATVANGIEFARDGGAAFVADTARGAVWRIALDAKGNVTAKLGCDTAYPANTLCADSLLVENPQLEGADGLVLDAAGDLWVAANERNAIVVVEPSGRVVEFFRNPPDTTSGLRNAGPLETPTSPLLLGRVFCVTQSDGNRRDNSPSSAGEVGPSTAFLGKVSCLQGLLPRPGRAADPLRRLPTVCRPAGRPLAAPRSPALSRSQPAVKRQRRSR
jgi:sugar lactone lactonase YvrE